MKECNGEENVPKTYARGNGYILQDAGAELSERRLPTRSSFNVITINNTWP